MRCDVLSLCNVKELGGVAWCGMGLLDCDDVLCAVGLLLLCGIIIRLG